MEHETIPSGAPAGRPFGYRGAEPRVHIPQAPYDLTDSLCGVEDYVGAAVAGVIEYVQVRTTRQQRAWAAGVFVLDSGERYEFHVFPDTYTAINGFLTEGGRCVLHVVVDRRTDPPMLNVRGISFEEPR